MNILKSHAVGINFLKQTLVFLPDAGLEEVLLVDAVGHERILEPDLTDNITIKNNGQNASRRTC